MVQMLGVGFLLFLFAVSLSLFSKSAELRARSRTELFYASQIREEAETIRLQNEKMHLEIMDMGSKETVVTEEKSNITDVEVNHDYDQKSIQKPKLKELDLDEKSLAFVSKFQPKQEKFNFQEVTEYEKPNAWFSFPEVDLHMNDRPEKGLYYVSGKVIDILDDMSAIISDGTGERMLYHHKVQNLSIGDIIISQVEIDRSIWNFITVWEINETSQLSGKKAM
ncbi:hypothetical protein BKP35_08975 [Anaerobacillus arseniciselenatis]|uniref:Uncharacterized protein n=1 Tax=Anaerobacillus arseniciselenatis TaxID=85682 RepID=A0A1S2LNW7_9BACI|nr:hypothetical protein [Anaerobacillus arseniciselenatis]OIJ13357.1 hypothetical protein BKP35_08975 [Anaerobacillus arseniciselenatis]